MKITIYTIADCQFSKAEKEYLASHNLQYEEKSLETNKDFLTEMLAISNNFAGTPVTRVEKDDGSIAVLKGFTKEEFDTTFGFATAPTDNKPPITKNESPVSAPPATEPVPPVEISPTSTTIPSNPEPINQVIIPDPLKSVMDDLQSKSQPTKPVAPLVEPPAIENPQPVNPPTDQPIQPKTDSIDSTNPTDSKPNTPSIPDFPADGKTSV